MPQVIDEYILEDIAQAHGINVKLLIPFVIARLAPFSRKCAARLTVILRDTSNSDETRHQLRLRWSPASIPEQPLAVPEKVTTELAACGVACAVLARYTSLSIDFVTNPGERFDYWMSDSTNDYGLEISGTMTERAKSCARLKARQLLENPYGASGYVVVVSFATKEVICAFHPFDEEEI